MPSSYTPTDPQNMTTEQRLAEIAIVLAQGVLRLHKSPTLTDSAARTATRPLATSIPVGQALIFPARQGSVSLVVNEPETPR